MTDRHDKKSAETGLRGEAHAERMLKKKGYKIIGRRVRVGKKDEIDIVARDGEILVFAEVKTRSSDEFGRPLSTVDRKKRRALSRAAVSYLKQLRYPEVSFRFDVVEVIVRHDGSDPLVEHVEDAFPLGTKYTLPY